MTDDHLGERMPAVARGEASWTAGEAAHLAGCAECAVEWQVVRRFVGRGVSPRIDADAVAAAVLARLRDDSQVVPLRPRRRWMGIAGLAAAASVALAVAVWQPWSTASEVAVVPSRERTMLPELDVLIESELEVVLAALEPQAVEPMGTVPRLGDLTDDELELLLQQVEES